MRAMLAGMLETSARLLRLLSLLSARRFWSGAELAESLEITGRTLRRDIDRLRNLGYPVEATPGVAGGYQLGAGAHLPPLLLEDDEALAVSIGLQTAARSDVSGIDEAAVRALAKLERVLPPRLRRRANVFRASILSMERSGPRVDPAVLTTLASACREHDRVCFGYAGRDRSGERKVEPVGLVHTGYRWYLVAWDVAREDWRTFRVDRITGEVNKGAPFSPRPPPEAGDLRKYVARSVSTAGYARQARVLLHAPLEEVAQHISPAAGLLEPIDDKRCSLLTGAPSLDALVLWITMLGVDFEVVEPPELVNHIRLLRARLGRALGELGSASVRAEEGDDGEIP